MKKILLACLPLFCFAKDARYWESLMTIHSPLSLNTKELLGISFGYGGVFNEDGFGWSGQVSFFPVMPYRLQAGSASGYLYYHITSLDSMLTLQVGAGLEVLHINYLASYSTVSPSIMVSSHFKVSDVMRLSTKVIHSFHNGVDIDTSVKAHFGFSYHIV